MAFGSMNDGGDDAPMSDINVTPLVDVMLVLLIVFMITMPVLTHSIQIELPVSGSQAKEEQKIDIKPLEIAVDPSGQYVIGADSSNLLSFDAVKAELNRIGSENPDTIVAIDADKSVAYEHVAQLLEAARDAKLSKIGFRMEVQEAPKP